MYLIKEIKIIYDIISEIYIYFLLKLWYLYDDKIFLLLFLNLLFFIIEGWFILWFM